MITYAILLFVVVKCLLGPLNKELPRLWTVLFILIWTHKQHTTTTAANQYLAAQMQRAYVYILGSLFHAFTLNSVCLINKRDYTIIMTIIHCRDFCMLNVSDTTIVLWLEGPLYNKRVGCLYRSSMCNMFYMYVLYIQKWGVSGGAIAEEYRWSERPPLSRDIGQVRITTIQHWQRKLTTASYVTETWINYLL